MPRYSNDLRRLVARQLHSGVSLNTIHLEYDISLSTLSIWRNKLSAGTLYDEIRSGGHPVVYDLVGLQGFVAQYPDIPKPTPTYSV